MKIDVTEKEAMAIYSARYLEKGRKRRAAISLIFVAVGIIVAALVMKVAGPSAGVGALLFLLMLFVIFSSKRVRRSREYANGQISGGSDTPECAQC